MIKLSKFTNCTYTSRLGRNYLIVACLHSILQWTTGVKVDQHTHTCGPQHLALLHICVWCASPVLFAQLCLLSLLARTRVRSTTLLPQSFLSISSPPLRPTPSSPTRLLLPPSPLPVPPPTSRSLGLLGDTLIG